MWVGQTRGVGELRYEMEHRLRRQKDEVWNGKGSRNQNGYVRWQKKSGKVGNSEQRGRELKVELETEFQLSRMRGS